MCPSDVKVKENLNLTRYTILGPVILHRYLLSTVKGQTGNLEYSVTGV